MSAKPCFVALTRATARNSLRSRPISTRNRARWDSSACFAPNARASSTSRGTSPGHASPSARASANSTGRLASGTSTFRSRTRLRQASMTSAFEASSASTSSSRRGRSSPRAISRATGVSRTAKACSTSAASAGMRAQRAASSARASAAWASPGADTPHGNPGDRKLMDGAQRRRQRREIDLRKLVLGLVEAPDQEQAPDLEIARMGRVRPVAMRLEGRSAAASAFVGQARSRDSERDLGLDDDASRAGHGLSRAEGARRPPHQRFRAVEIAELGHGDAAKRQRRRVVAERHPVQRAERIAHRERASRRRDQRVHRNPVTLVTPRGRQPDPSLTRNVRITENDHDHAQDRNT